MLLMVTGLAIVKFPTVGFASTAVVSVPLYVMGPVPNELALLKFNPALEFRTVPPAYVLFPYRNRLPEVRPIAPDKNNGEMASPPIGAEIVSPWWPGLPVVPTKKPC